MEGGGEKTEGEGCVGVAVIQQEGIVVTEECVVGTGMNLPMVQKAMFGRVGVAQLGAGRRKNTGPQSAWAVVSGYVWG